jgi:hypothetical protein
MQDNRSPHPIKVKVEMSYPMGWENHNGSWLDVQDKPWLIKNQLTSFKMSKGDNSTETPVSSILVTICATSNVEHKTSKGIGRRHLLERKDVNIGFEGT